MWMLFLSSFIKICRNIHQSVWQLLGVEIFFKMAAIAMVTKVQNGYQIQKSSNLGRFLWQRRPF
jgi:hypothetical protein